MFVRVDLGNRDFVTGEGEFGGELFVDGREVLAVTAPWCKEFNKGRFAGLENYFVKVVGNEVEDGG